MSIARPAKPANTTSATAVPINTWPDCLLSFIAASTARTFDYCLLIAFEFYPAWGTWPGTNFVKFVPLLYSGFAPFGNGSVVPIYAKTKALDVLERLARTPLSNSGFVSATNPETSVHVGLHLTA